ncbi:MAG: FixH family protein [Pseudomonadota bacterium]
MKKEITGWHVLGGFVVMFGIIVSVNLTLAYNAVATFPGLEVKNSYVASQQFQANRAAQLKLGWEVSAVLQDGEVRLEILEDGRAIAAKRIEQATLGHATNVSGDEELTFAFDGTALVAPAVIERGNLNLRLKARADDGTLFQQRVIVLVAR